MAKILRSKRDIDNLIKDRPVLHFIPTMGCLHQGHLKIVEHAKKNHNEKTLVSIFVNPTQFSEKRDFDEYPRDYDKDISKLELLKTDFIFIPDQKFIKRSMFSIKVGSFDKILCGLDRKNHFSGVATVVLKFLILLNPKYLYLGEKDFQQILVIRKLIKDFSINTKVKTFRTMRERKGLAFSSRNLKLSKAEKIIARNIFLELQKIKKIISYKPMHISELEKIKKTLIKLGFDQINYLEIRKEKDLELIDKNYENCRAFISANLNSVRLIDNIRLGKIRILKKKIEKL